MHPKSFFTLVLILASTFSYAQLSIPTLSLEYEAVAIDPAALPDIEAQIGANAHCVRVYLRIPEFWECQALFGDMSGALSVSSSTSFYQNNLGGPTPLDLSLAELATSPSASFDSWLTIGDEDADNNLMVVVPSNAVFADFEAGGDIFINDLFGASLFVPSDLLIAQNTIDADGRILISQFTTTGSVDACYNFQIRQFNSDGTLFDPPGPETTLVYQFNDQCINIPAPFVQPTYCDFDFDQNGFIGTSDLITLLVQYGCQTNCAIDSNGDGDTGIEEILFFLVAFGNSCP